MHIQRTRPAQRYDSVRSALNEFADSLSTDEKLLILANLMLHVNE
ncbi:MAG: hypothetical protein PHI98_03910 [Eubacteriales bacterium]|nr:hypothetical protein [Eubacteriales bacterium]